MQETSLTIEEIEVFIPDPIKISWFSGMSNEDRGQPWHVSHHHSPPTPPPGSRDDCTSVLTFHTYHSMDSLAFNDQNRIEE